MEFKDSSIAANWGGILMKTKMVLTTATRLSLVPLGMVLVSTCLTGCLVPPMANMQSARCMDEKQHRITPYATAVDQSDGVSGDEDTKAHIANNYGALIGFGTSHNSEFQIRLDRIQPAGAGDGYNFTSIGPKFGVVEDVFALLVPFGLYWNGTAIAFDTIQFHPGAILTLPVNKHLEINTAGKVILPLSEGAIRWYIVNLGLSVSSDVDRWALLPEVGFGWSSREGVESHLFTYGISIAFYPRSGG
jgi:hypothetical protein